MRQWHICLLSTLTTGVLFGWAALSASGQSNEAPVQVLPAPVATAAPWKSWGQFEENFPRPARDLLVVRVSKPHTKGKCRLASVDEEVLHCARGGGREQVIPKQDVEAVLLPGYHQRLWPWVSGLLTLGGGSIAAAVLIGSVAAAIPLSILGALILLSIGAVCMGDNGGPDTVIYELPGTKLEVSLY